LFTKWAVKWELKLLTFRVLSMFALETKQVVVLSLLVLLSMEGDQRE
jgi:hypothetical protein